MRTSSLQHPQSGSWLGSLPSPDLLLEVVALPMDGAGRVVVKAMGEIDSYSAPLLRAAIAVTLRRRGLQTLILNLRGVTFMGAAGATCLARTRRRCRARGVHMMVSHRGQRPLLRPLQLTGLLGLLNPDPQTGPDSSPPGTQQRAVAAGPIRPATALRLVPLGAR